MVGIIREVFSHAEDNDYILYDEDLVSIIVSNPLEHYWRD